MAWRFSALSLAAVLWLAYPVILGLLLSLFFWIHSANQQGKVLVIYVLLGLLLWGIVILYASKASHPKVIRWFAGWFVGFILIIFSQAIVETSIVSIVVIHGSLHPTLAYIGTIMHWTEEENFLLGDLYDNMQSWQVHLLTILQTTVAASVIFLMACRRLDWVRRDGRKKARDVVAVE